MICILIIHIIVLSLSMIGIKKRLHLAQLKNYKRHLIANELYRTIPNEKTKIVYTARIKRLGITIMIMYALFYSLLYIDSIYIYILAGIVLGLHRFDIIIALFITIPIERKKYNKYIINAKKKLSIMNANVIGITGSVGKTSTKQILYHLMCDDYICYASPKSYNTPYGITISINNAPIDTQVLILEMGARQRGDISALCEIAPPDMAIITAITASHLGSFGDIDNIVKTKYEIADYTDILYINANDNHLLDNRPRGAISAFIIDSIDIDNANHSADYIYAHSITYTIKGMDFVISYDNNDYPAHTSLLGEHNVSNILLAAKVCIDMGISIEKIIERISSIPSIPHRAELIVTEYGVNIIDDSYNASPLSALSSLKVLSKMPGKKIVATCGIIEAGDEQYNINYQLSQQISKVADILIIINKTNAKALLEGNSLEEYYITDSITDAQKTFGNILTKGDTLLILNDLPDDYE